VKKNLTLLYGFSFFDPFMIVIPVWVPYLATQGITMRQFMGQIGRGLASVVFLTALNEKISSAFRATVISMAQLGTRASFALLGPLVGYGIDRWGLPSVLSALGILFSIAFVCLLLPLVLWETALSPADELRA
jgi:hypothetical protein